MHATDLYPLLPFLIVVGWACVLLLIDLFIPRDRKGITAVLAAVGLIAALVVVLIDFGQTRQVFYGMIVQDGFSSFLQVIFLAVGVIGIAQAYD